MCKLPVAPVLFVPPGVTGVPDVADTGVCDVGVCTGPAGDPLTAAADATGCKDNTHTSTLLFQPSL